MGDGVADDTIALRRCTFESIASQRGINLHGRTYRITSIINIHGVPLIFNGRLNLDHATQRVCLLARYTPNPTYPDPVPPDWQGPVLLDLVVDGTRCTAADQSGLIYLERARGAVIAGCQVYGVHSGPGIYVRSTSFEENTKPFRPPLPLDTDWSDHAAVGTAFAPRLTLDPATTAPTCIRILTTDVALLGGELCHGIIVETPYKWDEPGVSSMHDHYQKHGRVKEIHNHIRGVVIAACSVQGGYYGIGLYSVAEAMICDNTMADSIRNISIQNNSRSINVLRNFLLGSSSASIHVAYGCQDIYVQQNLIEPDLAHGEGLMQTYVGCDNIHNAPNLSLIHI
mgnify:CR=1 FL=1